MLSLAVADRTLDRTYKGLMDVLVFNVQKREDIEGRDFIANRNINLLAEYAILLDAKNGKYVFQVPRNHLHGLVYKYEDCLSGIGHALATSICESEKRKGDLTV